MRNAYVVLVLALVLALWRMQPPVPGPEKGLAANFSAPRAFIDIKAIAQRPHPVGSAEHASVRDYIVGRMKALGLAPQLQAERSAASFGSTVVSAPVTNIIGTLKGRDPTKPALLIMSHYDTVPDSPGAADDSAGVAVSLEIARALALDGPPPRDVIFLVTDGEELGLLGATAFFRHHPLAARAGAVINFEARGDGGLTAMFETGPNNADAVAQYAGAVARPSANSLSRVIYKNMPNGTDLSVALERGLPALNFAFIGDEAAYHTPLATPAHLDLGSVQHMGDQGLGAARAFAARLPQQTADAVYSDILGFGLIAYPLWFGWVVLAVAAALSFWGLRAAAKTAPASWGKGILAAVLSLAVPAIALFAAGQSFGDCDHFLRLAHFDFLLAGAGALTVGLALLVAVLFRRAAIWQVLLLLQLVLGIALQALVPEAAFVLVWPALFGGAIATLRFAVFGGRDGVVPAVLSGALALLPLAMSGTSAIFLFTALGVDLPAVLVVALVSGLPLLLLMPQNRPRVWIPAAFAGLGVVVFAYGRYAGPTPEHPQPVLVRYIKDLDSGAAWRVAMLESTDPWTMQALGKPTLGPLPWSQGRKLLASPAEAVNLPDTDVVMLREGPNLRIVVQPQPGAYSTTVSVMGEEALAAAPFDSVTVPAGRRHDFRYYAPGPEGFTWVMAAPKRGKVAVVVRTLYPSWPAQATALPPLPPQYMAFGNHATTETVKRRVWTP